MAFMSNDARRSFGKSERAALLLAQGGRCAKCGVVLQDGFHVDHMTPWMAGGATDIVNGQALCPTCNLRKGAMQEDDGLREWQRIALQKMWSAEARNFLLVATPGAGKTRVALAALKQRRADGERRCVIVVPTRHLTFQWANEASGLNLQPWQSGEPWPRDMDGVTITYQALIESTPLFRKFVSECPSSVVLDEVHHCGDSKTWGENVRHAFEPARFRLLLSGTPFRSDCKAIPFVNYIDGQGQPDFVYGYGDALRDRVCRPVYFQRRGGSGEWVSRNGQQIAASFDDGLDQKQASERLRTALDPSGEWLPSVLIEANDRLHQLRLTHSAAGGIVVCMDQEHAKRVADLMVRLGSHPLVAISEDPNSSEVIRRFAAGSDPWLIAVRLVSEGIDIPRLRVGVYATNTTTELFFRQVVGRVVRWQPELEEQEAYCFIPDDPTLRSHAEAIREQVIHWLEEEEQEDVMPTQRLPREEFVLGSLFQPLAFGEAENRGTLIGREHVRPDEERIAAAAQIRSNDPWIKAVPVASLALFLRLSDGPKESPAQSRESLATPVPKYQGKVLLRGRGNKLVQKIAHRFNMEHKDVAIALNKAVGAWSVADATEEQLERRFEIAREWLSTGMLPRP
jgi:superfamily II DNA or RNA helicase